jgi:hypothetical protein
VPALAALAGVGCATALSTSQPAHLPPKGHVQAEVGLDISYSNGAINKVLDAAESLDQASAQRMLTDDEKRTILEGGAHLGLNPPAFIPHAGIGYAPFEGWEVTARFAASGWRGGVRRQLLSQETSGVDLAIGAGVGSAAFDPPIHGVLSTIDVDHFDRWNFDVPLALGRHGVWYRWWIGAHVIYSLMSENMTLHLQNDMTVTGSVSGRGLYAGGYAGAALGYRSLFVGPELTLAELIGHADVEAMGQRTRADLGSFIVYPSLAIMGEF